MMWNFLIVLVAVVIYCYTSEFYKLVDTVSYSVNLPEKLDGRLQPNEKLDTAERLFENALHWPESFALKSGQIFTGLGDGRIIRLSGDKYITVSRTGKDCAGQHEEHICGRPLGMQFDKNGLLYVVDAYLGLLTVDVKTGKKNNLLPATTIVNGEHLQFLNNLALDEKEGVIYLTQSSIKWDIGMVIVSIIEHESSGRLLKYDLKTKDVSVLLSNLSFPNGVEFSHDGSALLIAEGNNNKIFKYHLQGSKKGLVTDLLVLPGEPDNITKNKRGNYWVGISSARSKEFPALHDRFSEKPFFRMLFLHMYRLITTPFSAILKLIPHKIANTIGFELKTGRIIADIPLGHYGMIIEFNDEGTVVQSLQSPSGKVSHIAEVLEHNGYLYLGSWRNHYIGRVKL